MERYLLPKKITVPRGVENGANLKVKKDLQIGLCETCVTIFPENSYVILDFGKELCGGVRIITFLAANTRVRIRFGESLTECSAELGGRQNATNDHALRDFYVNLQNFSDMTFGGTGFRFIRLDFESKAVIKSIYAQSRILNAKPIYVYKGKDKEIKDIFSTAKRTIDLCASGEYLWDGIKRDRLVWIGDIYPEMLALTTLYGRTKIVERSMDFIKAQTPLPAWMNNFPMYSMWWLIILADYVKETGATDFAEKQIDYIKGLIELMLEHVSADGELNYPSNFVDWPTHNKPDEIHGVRAINVIAAKKAAELLKSFGESAANAEELLRRLMKKEITVSSSKSVLGLKYFAVGLNEEDKQKLLAGGAEGVTTFMSYFILKAIASFDRAKAVEIMKTYYGGMLKKGATTFWEDFDIKWAENSCRIDRLPQKGEKDIHGDFGAYCYEGFRHSLCHGWSAGVIKFIRELEN